MNEIVNKNRSDTINPILVAASSSVKNVAGCIVKFIEKSDSGVVELRAIGASAVNQLVKAVAVARGIFATQGYDLLMCPGFFETSVTKENDEEKRTAIRAFVFINESRKAGV